MDKAAQEIPKQHCPPMEETNLLLSRQSSMLAVMHVCLPSLFHGLHLCHQVIKFLVYWGIGAFLLWAPSLEMCLFWKLYKPEYYTIDAGVVNSDPMLIGVLQAHKSRVSAITWEVSSEGSSKSSLLLATGCSDGRWAWMHDYCVLFENGYVLSLAISCIGCLHIFLWALHE